MSRKEHNKVHLHTQMGNYFNEKVEIHIWVLQKDIQRYKFTFVKIELMNQVFCSGQCERKVN